MIIPGNGKTMETKKLFNYEKDHKNDNCLFQVVASLNRILHVTLFERAKNLLEVTAGHLNKRKQACLANCLSLGQFNLEQLGIFATVAEQNYYLRFNRTKIFTKNLA